MTGVQTCALPICALGTLALGEFVLVLRGREYRAAIEEASKKRGTRTLNVDVPVNVQSIYMTAIPTAEGTMQFRDDLYGLDRYFLDAQKKRTDTVVAERTQQRRVASLAR